MALPKDEKHAVINLVLCNEDCSAHQHPEILARFSRLSQGDPLGAPI
jgi:hypothetical protein